VVTGAGKAHFCKNTMKPMTFTKNKLTFVKMIVF
jgi:hypothetical protein